MLTQKVVVGGKEVGGFGRELLMYFNDCKHNSKFSNNSMHKNFTSLSIRDENS